MYSGPKAENDRIIKATSSRDKGPKLSESEEYPNITTTKIGIIIDSAKTIENLLFNDINSTKH